MILSKDCKSRYLRRMISKLIKMIDNELYCDVHLKEDESYFFPAEDYYDNDGNYGDLLIKSRRSNWDTILEMVPLIGEAYAHYLMLTEGVEEPEKPPILEYYPRHIICLAFAVEHHPMSLWEESFLIET